MKPSFAQLLPRRASDSDVIRSPTSVARDGASSGLIRRLIPSFGRKSSNAGIITPYTYVSPAELKAAISVPKQVVVVETEMARMESALSAPEFTTPRPAPPTPARPRFSGSTTRSTISDSEMSNGRAIMYNNSVEYLKQWDGMTKTPNNGQVGTRFYQVAGIDDLGNYFSELSVNNVDVNRPQLNYDRVERGEVIPINSEYIIQDGEYAVAPLAMSRVGTGAGPGSAKVTLEPLTRNSVDVDQAPTPPLSPDLPIVPINAKAPPKAADPEEPKPDECDCSICKRAVRVDVSKMSEEEQVQFALSRSMDDYVAASY